MVCPGDWETRHPQDFVRGVIDAIAPPWTRPEPGVFWKNALSFVSNNVSTLIALYIKWTPSKQEINGSSINQKPLG